MIKINSTSSMWLKAKIFKPDKTGVYEVKYDGHYSDDESRYTRGLFGLPWLCYWSDEKYGLRKITYWRKVN